MQADVWKALLRRVPPEQIDNLMLMTAEGTEINVQALFRMEEDYLVLRGRLAGSNDAGRVFFVPYEHLDHIGFQRPLLDAQVQALFGEAPAAPAEPPPAPEAAAAPAPEPTPAAAAEARPEPPPAPAGPLARLPSRSAIIARLRQRTEVAQSGGDSPPKQ
jgi:hypothetical protein